MKTIKKLILLGAVAVMALTGATANAQYNLNNNVLAGETDAVLNASVNPNGTATSAWFEYGTDMNMVSFNQTPHTYVGSSVGEIPFSQKIINLNSGTVYYYRAVANNGTTVKGNIVSFTTTSNSFAPATTYTNTNYSNNNVVYTNPTPTNYNTTANTANNNGGVSITNITATGAILNAVFTNPNGVNAQGYFEWGPTTAFGNTTPMTNLGTGYTSNFSGVLSQLNPNTTYYFRALVVTQNGQTYKGGIRNFQTYGSTVSTNNTVSQGPSVTTSQEQLVENQMNNNVVNNNTNLSANTLFGVSFLPNNIFGWLLLLLVILAVVWAIRKLAQPTTYVTTR